MKIYFDGGCRPNPGRMEVAVVARGQLHYAADVGAGCSQEAEWSALIHALRVARIMGEDDILLLGDAKGVIDQANGIGKCRTERLQELRATFQEQASGFKSMRVRYIKRSQNLAGIALEKKRQHPRAVEDAIHQRGFEQ